MIEVAVIGAGSAGLVTARHLLANGLKCCIFEATSTLGGSWSSPLPATATEATATARHKGLHTNLSKHSCRFSDFPWPDDAPTFPSKDDMDRYFTSYANEFVLPFAEESIETTSDECTEEEGDADSSSSSSSSCSLLYDCKVTKISPILGSSVLENRLEEKQHPQKRHQYRVEWTDSVHQTQHSKDFGGVVIATGFLTKPRYPPGLLSAFLKDKEHIGDNCNDGSNDSARLQILHSKDYVRDESFADKQDEKVVVVGASHSALEIAVDVSKSVEAPVTVIMSRIPWVIPRYVPVASSSSADAPATAASPAFLPLDLAFYRRRKDNNHVETTSLTREACRKRHRDLRAVVGPKQDRILPVPQSSFDEPPMVAINDYFLDLVIDGTIEVVQGRFEGITDDERGLRISRASDDDLVLSGITSLICCTGYTPDLESCCGELEEADSESESSSSSSSSILKTIDYDPTDWFSPMTTHLETFHPELPNLALVGMYRGSYMGVVEMQARLAAGVLSGNVILSPEVMERGLETSRLIRRPDPLLRPQFPRFDYVGFMDSLAESLSMPNGEESTIPNPESLAEGSIVTPAFYQPDPVLADLARGELDREIERGTNGYHLPRVVSSALVGSWSFERNIVHFSNGGRTIAQRQYIHGTVRYSRAKDLGHVLYREDGLFEISPSKSLPVFREYEYVCSLDEDGGGGALELYFVEGGKRTYIFLSLKFQHQDKDGYWVATNDHLCIKDLYTGNFRIKLDGLTATEVIITYRVKGPAKDYESTTIMKPRQF